MKKVKSIYYNILLACLSKRPQAAAQLPVATNEESDIIQEFYDTLAAQTRPGLLQQLIKQALREPTCQ